MNEENVQTETVMTVKFGRVLTAEEQREMEDTVENFMPPNCRSSIEFDERET